MTTSPGSIESRFPADDALTAELGHSWAWYLAAGTIAVALGFIVLAWRTQTLFVITYFAGAVFLFVGLAGLIAAILVPAYRWPRLAAAIGHVAIGIIILVWPHITLYVVALLIALGFLLGGVSEVVVALSDVHSRHWWIRLIGGIAMLGIAVWAIRDPGHALQILIVLLGIWMILWGILEIMGAFVVRYAERAGATLR